MSISLKRRINLLLESPHIAYWRICGKESQREFRALNRSDGDVDREALLKQIVDNYNKCLDAMPNMTRAERRSKKYKMKTFSTMEAE